MQWQKVGHRGAPKEFPGNTLKGFQRAVALGCTMVECDIRQAADGELVLAHDPEVTDVLGRTYVVAEHPSGELAALDLGAGEGPPTLMALAHWASGRCAIMADMKCEGNGVEERVVEALSLLPTGAKVVPGAGHTSRLRFRALDPALPLSLSIGRTDEQMNRPGGFEELLPTIDTQAVTWEHPLLDAPRIAALHQMGLRVYAWTVDDLLTIRRLVAEGVDGVISNRPDLLATIE